MPIKYLIALTVLVLSGCTMVPQGGIGANYVSYNNLKIITEKEAEALTRDERSNRIEKDMKAVGFQTVRVSPLVDGFSDSVVSIYRNQYKLIQKYKVVVDNHKDVMSFIHANKGKSSKELKLEAERFDQLALNESEKIAPKLKQYKQANDDIQKENLKLAGELLLHSGKLALIFKDNAEQMLRAEAMLMLANLGKVQKAYKAAEVRIHLAKLANDFIDQEKAVLDITKQIQEILNEKL